MSTPCPPTRCTNLIDESFNLGVLSVATTLWLPHQSWFVTSFCVCSMSGSCAPAPLRVKILQSPSICVSPQVTTCLRVRCWLTSSAVSNARNPLPRVEVKWDIFLVLRNLQSDKFHPDSVSLRDLTLKYLFRGFSSCSPSQRATHTRTLLLSVSAGPSGLRS